MIYNNKANMVVLRKSCLPINRFDSNYLLYWKSMYLLIMAKEDKITSRGVV